MALTSPQCRTSEVFLVHCSIRTFRSIISLFSPALSLVRCLSPRCKTSKLIMKRPLSNNWRRNRNGSVLRGKLVLSSSAQSFASSHFPSLNICLLAVMVGAKQGPQIQRQPLHFATTTSHANTPHPPSRNNPRRPQREKKTSAAQVSEVIFNIWPSDWRSCCRVDDGPFFFAHLPRRKDGGCRETLSLFHRLCHGPPLG